MVVAIIVAVVLMAASAHPVRPKPADFIGITPARSCCMHRTEDIRHGLFWAPQTLPKAEPTVPSYGPPIEYGPPPLPSRGLEKQAGA